MLDKFNMWLTRCKKAVPASKTDGMTMDAPMQHYGPHAITTILLWDYYTEASIPGGSVSGHCKASGLTDDRSGDTDEWTIGRTSFRFAFMKL